MIVNLSGGGSVLPTLTNPGTASDMLAGKQLIDANGNLVTGTIPSQGAQTITPGTTSKTIASGQYLSGTQTILGDSDLVASNIKSGVNIFGVTGTLSAEAKIGTLSSSMFSIAQYGGANHQVIDFPIQVTRLVALAFYVSYGSGRLLWVAGDYGSYPSLPIIGGQYSYVITNSSTASSFNFGQYGGGAINAYRLIDGSINTGLWTYSQSPSPGVYIYV